MRAAAFVKLVEENRKEKEKAAKELEKRRQVISKPIRPDVEVVVPTTSPRRKVFKSKAIISDESDDEVVEQPREVIPRGTKVVRTWKQMTTMLLFPLIFPKLAPPVLVARAKYATSKGNDVAGLVTMPPIDRKAEGTEAAEQLARIAEQNQDIINLLQKSIVVQEQMLGIMVRAERRVIEAMEESEKGEDEDGDEDGEGEEDEEEIEEVKRREEIREGKKRAE
ncbi:hypothetical protein GGU11DRAFT_761564 [Lentinula aff. detonsa]|nr:hypothetical protein GGU11DRAFT_761564 [Lentinula aff. detonsa]